MADLWAQLDLAAAAPERLECRVSPAGKRPRSPARWHLPAARDRVKAAPPATVVPAATRLRTARMDRRVAMALAARWVAAAVPAAVAVAVAADSSAVKAARAVAAATAPTAASSSSSCPRDASVH